MKFFRIWQLGNSKAFIGRYTKKCHTMKVFSETIFSKRSPVPIIKFWKKARRVPLKCSRTILFWKVILQQTLTREVWSTLQIKAKIPFDWLKKLVLRLVMEKMFIPGFFFWKDDRNTARDYYDTAIIRSSCQFTSVPRKIANFRGVLGIFFE